VKAADKRYGSASDGYARWVTDGSSDCVEAALACAEACDEAAGRLVAGGDREVVDALIAAVATSRLLAELLLESGELEPGLAALCRAACVRCVELAGDDPALAEAAEACAECAECLR
jgi:hypothetical protein